MTGAALAGAIITWIANIAYLGGLSPVAGLDPTPFSFVLTGVIYAYTLYRYRLFDLVPVSRHALLENMIEGLLVLDNADQALYQAKNSGRNRCVVRAVETRLPR